MLIDCIELAIFASFLHREWKQNAKKVHERPEAKISPFGNILRSRLGCMHSPSA